MTEQFDFSNIAFVIKNL